MRSVLVLAALFCATAAHATDHTPKVSWGKPGVTLDQYRSDAVECGRAGYYRDISKTEQVATFRRATRMLDLNENFSPASTPDEIMNAVKNSAAIVAGTRPEKRFAELRSFQEAAMNQCLLQRGYTRFRLTEDQRDHVRRLRIGSPERHAYLHALASDPRVLHDQAVAA